MGCCGDNRKFNCGEKIQAICVYYHGYLPEYSELEEDCATVEETIDEIYHHQEEILDSIDLSELGNDCIDYSSYQEGEKLKVREALLAIEDYICQDDTEEGCCLDVSAIDVKCLTDVCDNPISTQTQLLQAIIDKLCLLEFQINQINQQ